jgi:hypothetical protein
MGDAAGYFQMGTDVFEKGCDKIIAKSGADLGENNSYFEWFTPPTDGQLSELRNKIDDIIKPFGNKYTITNKE